MPASATEATAHPQTTTKSGIVAGRSRNGVHRFVGIPFAAPTSGENRFRAPQPPESWDGVRQANRFGDVCWQTAPPGIGEFLGSGRAQSFDSLNLNVWTADLDGTQPVFVWIHGGAFTMGSGADYNGTSFARNGVVCVSFNYRLGIEGFLDAATIAGEPVHGSGNFGMLDQQFALQWVRDNIAAFGGDPSNVTIAGESAGGMSVGTQLAMPGSAGLFQRAIPQSGAGHNCLPADVAADVARRVGEKLGVSDLASLRAVSAEDTLATQTAIEAELRSAAFDADYETMALTPMMAFTPMVDGEIVPTAPIDAVAAGASKDVDLLIGTTRHEFRLFSVLIPDLIALGPDGLNDVAVRVLEGKVPLEDLQAAYGEAVPGINGMDLFAAAMTDRVFTVPSIRLADAHAGAGGRGSTHRYLFAWETATLGGMLKSCHALEIPFMFDVLDDPMGQFFAGADAPRDLAGAMHGAWVSFAEDGDPGHDGLPAWPAYDAAVRPTMVFNTASTVVDDPFAPEHRLFDGVI